MKNEFWTAIYFDLSEKEYENGDHVSGFCERQREEMEKGFTVQLYYTDCAEVQITEISDDTFYYETEYEDMCGEWRTEKRYVVVLGYEEGEEK